MILRSLRVADWRCFLNEVTLGPFDEALNIIHAPNGTGKSTLFEALRRALLDGHKVTGRDVEMLRPWGRVLSPKVTVEFVHGGVEYRISKQFLDDSCALLERKEDGRYQHLAEGVSADEQTRTLLTRNPPGRGLARQENWGMAQVLWAPQGNLVLAGLSGDLVADIRSALSAQIGGAGGPLEKRIEDRYQEFFTSKGKLKTGRDAPPLIRLQQQLEQAAEAKRKALDAYLLFENTARRVEDLRARRAQAGHDAEEIGAAMRKTRERAETFRSLSAEKKQRAEQLKAAEAQHKELAQRVFMIAEAEARRCEARKLIARLEEDISLGARERNAREKDLARAKAALEDARQGRQSVDRAEQLAESARRFAECTKAVAESRALMRRVRQIELTLAAAKEERARVLAPDSKALRAIRKSVKDRDDARSRIEASLITLEVVPENDAVLELLAGESPGPRRAGAGSPTVVQGSPEVVADLRGVARLRAWGPPGSIEEHREAKAKAERKLAELTEPFGTSDVEALEALSDKAGIMDEGIAESEIRLATLLADRTVEELLQEQNAQEAVLAGILEQHPDWEQSPPDPSGLRSTAQELKRGFDSEVDCAEMAWEKAQSAFTAAVQQEQAAAGRLAAERKSCASLDSRIAELTKDGKEPRDRQTELQRLALAWEAACGRLAEIESRLAEYQDDPVAALESLEAQLEAAREAASGAREQEIREESRLEGLAAQGPYSALAMAEECVAHLQRDIEREQLRVDAIRLLRDTVAACRAEAVAAVTGPVESAATRILQRIAGPRLGRIQLGENFEPSSIRPETADESVILENLSGGEQEQLHLATRLALAHALRNDERQLVVLDDVLTASDAARLARVMNVLEEAAQDLQVLILTCHPERYRALKTGRFFDLEEAVQCR